MKQENKDIQEEMIYLYIWNEKFNRIDVNSWKNVSCGKMLKKYELKSLV